MAIDSPPMAQIASLQPPPANEQHQEPTLCQPLDGEKPDSDLSPSHACASPRNLSACSFYSGRNAWGATVNLLNQGPAPARTGLLRGLARVRQARQNQLSPNGRAAFDAFPQIRLLFAGRPMLDKGWSASPAPSSRSHSPESSDDADLPQGHHGNPSGWIRGPARSSSSLQLMFADLLPPYFDRQPTAHGVLLTHEPQASGPTQPRWMSTPPGSLTTSPLPVAQGDSRYELPGNPEASRKLFHFHDAGGARLSASPPLQNAPASPALSAAAPGGRAKKSFPCTAQDCQRLFSTRSHLKRHLRMHSGERPFVCSFPGCASRFSRHDNCLQHFRTHFKRGPSQPSSVGDLSSPDGPAPGS